MQPLAETIKAETRPYHVLRLGQHNIDDLARLSAAIYPKAKPLRYFKKKYDTAFTGIAYVGFIAYAEGEPIAYYGVIPCFVQYQGVKLMAAQSADTMTHPDFRFRGMFVELSKMTFDLCRQLGIRLIFGFPNQNSLHGAIHKLGWTMIGSLDYFRIDLKRSLAVAILKRLKLTGIHNVYVQLVLRKYFSSEKGLPNPFFDEGFAGVVRDLQYLDYRRYSHTKVIAIGACKIWLKTGSVWTIGCLQGASPENFPTVISQLKALARMAGVQRIDFHLSTGTELHRIFSSQVIPVPSFPTLFQDFGQGIPLDKFKFSFADIDIF